MSFANIFSHSEGCLFMLCDDLEGWDKEGGREAQEGGDMGTYVCIWLICCTTETNTVL